jgi:hypothetical protein
MIHAACDSAYAVADVIVIHDGERYGNFERAIELAKGGGTTMRRIDRAALAAAAREGCP